MMTSGLPSPLISAMTGEDQILTPAAKSVVLPTVVCPLLLMAMTSPLASPTTTYVSLPSPLRSGDGGRKI